MKTRNEFSDIRFKCPRCEKHLVIDAKGAGFAIICPDCQMQMVVPDQSHSLAQKQSKPSVPSEVRSIVESKEVEWEFQGSPVTVIPERTTTTLINKAFSDFQGASDLSPESKFIYQTIRTLHKDHTKRAKLAAAEKRFGPDYRRRHLPEMLDLLLQFLAWCLDGHRVTAPEIEAVLELRTLLDIRDGDLYSERKEAVRRLLEQQIDWMEDDFRISRGEELYLVDLQRVFDLSYDQLLELAQPHVAKILDNLYLQLSIVDTQDLRLQVDQLMKVFCMLNYRPFESTKEEADEVAGRMIPQSVKDAVWRRDQGKCTVCGSREDLEFDHIIPFSLGGSNTYRNIQVLCQNCNRSKAAQIG